MLFERTQSAPMTALDPSAELRERGGPPNALSPCPLEEAHVSISKDLTSLSESSDRPVLSPMQGELTVIIG